MKLSSPFNPVVVARLFNIMPLTRSRPLVVAALVLRGPLAVAQGVLADAGFESGTFVPGGTGGWVAYSGSPAFVQSTARSGNWSLQANYAPMMDGSIVHQWVAVQPGSRYALTGWGMTPVRLGNNRVGYLDLTFCDINHVPIGQGNESGTISSSSPLNTWIALSVTGTAPTGAAYAEVIAGVGFPYFQTLGNNAVYFDDLTLSQIPEPAVHALLMTGLSGGLWFHSRKRQSWRVER